MFCRIFIEMIVQRLAPVCRFLAFQQRQQRYSLNIFRNRSTSQIQESRSIVDVLYQLRNISPSLEIFRQMHDQWCMHGFFIHEPFVEPSVFAHIESLVRSINDQRIVHQTFFLQIVKYTTYIVIQSLYNLRIIAHITLELPFGQLLSLRVLFIELFDDRFIESIILLAFFRIQASDEAFVRALQRSFLVLAVHLGIIHDIHVFPDTHLLCGSSRTSFVVIIEVFRHGERLVFIQRQVFQLRKPVAMDCLVMNEQAERLFLIPLILHPVNTHIRDQVGQITFFLNGIIFHGDESRIVVIALSRKNFPIIESRRQAFQMPFSDNRRLISCFLKQLRHGLLGSVEYTGCIVCKSVGMAVFAGQHTSTARSAQGIGNKTVDETHAIISDPVQIRSFNIPCVVTTHHLSCMVISHDVNNVVLFRGFFLLRGTAGQYGQQGCNARYRTNERVTS